MDAIARELADRWGFLPLEELPGGHCSRVYADHELVLKVPWQGEEQTSGCVFALAMSGGVGPVVVDSDPATGSLLMERIVPGTSLDLAGLDFSECLEVFLGLALPLRELDSSGLMPLASYYWACTPLLEWLLATSPPPVSLHGDLHHLNILQGSRWMAIDPKGLVGDPAYEGIAFLRNPIDDPRLASTAEERLEAISAGLSVPSSRVLAWALADLRADAESRERTHPWSKLEKALEALAERKGLGYNS